MVSWLVDMPQYEHKSGALAPRYANIWEYEARTNPLDPDCFVLCAPTILYPIEVTLKIPVLLHLLHPNDYHNNDYHL